MRRMHRILLLLLFLILLLSNTTNVFAQSFLPAFPGAEGFGARSIGGRGGQILEVTNLNDDGPGSFRAALLTPGPRIIVFRVSGTIAFDPTRKWPVVTEPYLTIAGQTAPGDGVTIKGEIEINTHDVIIRYLRIRPGYEVYNPSSGDGVYMSMASNVILDHCSISWSTDGVLDIGGGSNITVQWTSASEALDCAPNGHEETCHSTGPSLGNDLTNVTFHHNLFAHNSHRNPKAILDHDQGVFQYINNVVYDTNIGGQYSGYLNQAFYIDAINNYYKRGLPVISPDLPLGRQPHNFAENDVDNRRGTVFLYTLNTLSPYKTSLAVPEEVNLATYDTDVRLPRSPKINPPAVNYTSSLDAYNDILNEVGATLPVRDAADLRLIASVRNNTGDIIDIPEQVGGWPVLQGGPLAPDSDHDGMPDNWENTYGFTSSNASDGSQDADGDGYTNVEEYLNNTHPLSREATPTFPGLIPNLPITTYLLPQGNNLAPNGSFEIDPFIDYAVTKAITSDSITWVTDQFHSGSRSVKAVTSGTMDQSSSLRLKPQKITTNNSKGYYATVWVKFGSDKPYGKLRLEFYDINGIWQKSAVSNIGFGTNWMQIYVEEDPRTDSAYVVPSISIFGPGTMWVDDLEVVTGDNTGLCGQGICSSGETCSTCSDDCGYCPISSASPTPQPSNLPSPTSSPIGNNLILNPQFELGTTNWLFHTDGAGTFTTPSGGSTGQYASISITAPGTNVQLYQTGFSLESGKEYRLVFDARSNTGHDLQTSIFQHTSPYTNFGLSNVTADLTSSWQTFSTDFIASGFTGIHTDTRLMFWLAPFDAAGDQYFIDNVILTELTTPLPGDANGDGTVDLTDIHIWFTNYGQSGGIGQGNFNGDTKVNLLDFGVWVLGFGN